MSETSYQYTFFKTHPAEFDNLVQAVSNDMPQSELLVALGLRDILEQRDEHLESFELQDSKLTLCVSASPSSDVNNALVRAFKEYGCQFCHIDMFNTQVGEGTDFYLHRGRPLSDAQSKLFQDKFDPSNKVNNLIKLGATGLQQALEEGLDPNTNIDGRSLLELAAHASNKLAFDLLLAANADVNVVSKHGEALVFELAEYDEIAQQGFVAALVEHGADIAKNNSNDQSFLWVLGASDLALAEKLIADGVKFTRPEDAYDDEPLDNLRVSYAHNDTEKREAFFQSVLSDNEQHPELADLLCANNDTVRLGQMISNGFVPFAATVADEADDDAERFSLLSSAIDSNSTDVIATLLSQLHEKEIDYSASAEYFVYCLAEHANATAFIKTIISRYPESANYEALTMAVNNNALENAQLFIDNNVPVEQEDEEPLLHTDLTTLSPEMFALLIKAGCDPTELGYDEESEGEVSAFEKAVTYDIRPDTRQAFIAWLDNAEDNVALSHYAQLGMDDKFQVRWDSMSAESRAKVNLDELMFLAVGSNNARVVRLCLEQGIKVDHRHEGGATMFEVAVLTGSHSVVNLLLKRGLSADSAFDQAAVSATAAHFASQDEADADNLEFDDDYDDDDDEAGDALLRAMGLGDGVLSEEQKAVSKLVNDDVGMPAQNVNCLVVTAVSGDAAGMALLLAANASPNVDTGEHGWTPINYAVMNGHTQCVAMLIKAGATLDGKDEAGLSPVHYAALRGHVDVLKLLLEANAPTDLLSESEKQTPLLMACATSFVRDDDSTIDVLLAHGVDVNSVDVSGCSALTLACYAGKEKLIAALLNNGADVNQINDEGETPYDVYIDRHTVPEAFELAKLKPTSKAVAFSKGLGLVISSFKSLVLAFVLFVLGAKFIGAMVGLLIAVAYLGYKSVSRVRGMLRRRTIEGGRDLIREEVEEAQKDASTNVLGLGLAALEKAYASNEVSQKQEQAIIDSWDNDGPAAAST